VQLAGRFSGLTHDVAWDLYRGAKPDAPGKSWMGQQVRYRDLGIQLECVQTMRALLMLSSKHAS
jgi:hypothetical protein